MSQPQPAFAIGDRVRILIDLTSASWAPEQPDIPAGALGTIDYIHPTHNNPTVAAGYGVMLDDSVDHLSAWMAPTDIEPAGGDRMTTLKPVVQATRYTVSCMPEGAAPDAHVFALHVERNLDGSWIVTDGWGYLAANGIWGDPMGLRSPEYRHDLDTALRLAKAAAPNVIVNGMTPAGALARIAKIKAAE